MNPAEIVAALIGVVLDLAEGADEKQKAEIRTLLADAEAGLRAVAPNGPRIRALVEERRRLRGETP